MTEVISRIPQQISKVDDKKRKVSEDASSIPSRIPRLSDKNQKQLSRNGSSPDVSITSFSPIPSNPSTSRTDGEGNRTPKCEAFLMTGDKILNLDHKVSPSYAKICQDQLPPTMLNNTSSPIRRLDEYSSLSKQKHADSEPMVPPSHSENILDQYQNSTDMLASNDSTLASHAPHVSTKHQSSCTLPEGAIHHITPSTASTPKRNGGEFNKQHSFIIAKFLQDSSNGDRAAKSLGVSRGVQNIEGESSNKPISMFPAKRDISAIVKQLFNLENCTRSDVALFFRQKHDFVDTVIKEYFDMFNFAGLRIDAALRELLNHLCLTGETSDRANLLYHFSARYFECNPTLFSSVDQIHALTCSLILLNTDLHGVTAGKKMTLREFVDNLGHTQYTYERSMLKTLYNSVKSTSFNYMDDESGKSATVNSKTSGVLRRLSRKISKKGTEAFELIDYKHGWLVKKSVYDSDGKQTPFGRRKWQMYYATLRGMVLYLHKNEHGFDKGTFNAYNNCILLHHALASRAEDYQKRQNVFRVYTAELGEILFETADPSEVNNWIDAINFVAAAFSSPALPIPVSSDQTFTFFKPVLSSTPSQWPLHMQLRQHEEKVIEMEQVLQRLKNGAPPIKARGKKVQHYFYCQRYIDHQKDRYLAYVKILKEKLSRVSQTELCSRASSLRRVTPTKPHSHITSIAITNNPSPCQSPPNTTSTASTARKNFLRCNSNYSDMYQIPPTATSTGSFARKNSLKTGKPSITSENSSFGAATETSSQSMNDNSSQANALAEAMKIANGCLPYSPSGGGPSHHSHEEERYKVAQPYPKL